jgi:signal transduction histidine kinase
VIRALTNLLHNALQASPRGGEVRIVVQYQEDAVQIAVEDEGGGIPKEQLDRVFKPFFTTKNQGTGLGLPITKRIVEEHNGDIRVKSRLGGGTRVLLSFPVAVEELSDGEPNRKQK